jgi:hypothetical protein
VCQLHFFTLYDDESGSCIQLAGRGRGHPGKPSPIHLLDCGKDCLAEILAVPPALLTNLLFT